MRIGVEVTITMSSTYHDMLSAGSRKGQLRGTLQGSCFPICEQSHQQGRAPCIHLAARELRSYAFAWIGISYVNMSRGMFAYGEELRNLGMGFES